MGFLNIGSMTIGKILGIPLKLHFTLFILAPVFVWLLGNYFASLGLALPLWQYYGLLGIASFLAMEASIVVHELAHCWVSKRNGAPARNITLSIFGGVAFIEKDPKSAQEEFKVAIAGPAISFILAGIFWTIQRFLFEHTGINPLSLISNMIFLINLALGAFNLFIPAFPMDGGRILKSILWKKWGEIKASYWALVVGKIFGLILTAAGFASILFLKNWLGGSVMAGIGLGLFLQKEPSRNAAHGATGKPADQKKRKTWLVILICIGSLLLISAAIFLYSVRESSIEKLNYSGPGSFIEKADKGQLRELHTSGQTYRGIYGEDGKLVKFKTVVPLATYFYIGQNSYNPEEYYRIIYNGLYKKDLKISTEPYRVNPGVETYVFYGLGFIFLIAGFSAVWYWLWGKQMRETKKFLEIAGRKFSANVKFNDIAGIEGAKEELKEIVYFTRDSERYNEAGAQIPRGVILYGPHGCGKTLLAKAVANEAGVPVFGISGSEFVEMFVGVGASRIRDLFGEAKKNAPCIIFVDEIDALLLVRGPEIGGGARGEQNQTVNQFLAETDGIESGQGIVIIGATNRLDMIDPAAIRAGRFDKKIEISWPDAKGRLEILKIHTRNKPLAEDINLEKLAIELKPRTSGADIQNICNTAAMLAVRERLEEESEKKEKINTPIKIAKTHFSEAIDRILYGLENKNRVMSDDDVKGTAYHEAGHAIIIYHSKHLDPVRKITIIGRGEFLGYVDTAPKEESFTETKEKLDEKVLMCLGGLAAEKVFLRTQTTGARTDLANATLLKLVMNYQYGMGKAGPIGLPFNLEEAIKTGSLDESLLKILKKEIAPEIQKSLEEAEKILQKYEPEVKKLVEELVKRETIMGDEFINILKEVKTASQ